MQNHRYTVYYKWLQKPKLAHAEVIGIKFHDAYEVEHLYQTDFSSLNLFDIVNKDGTVQTHTSKDLVDDQELLHKAKKFKLVKRKDADNYRGYMAFNAQLSVDEPFLHTTSFYYIHQSTIFNNRGMDIIDFNKNSDTIMPKSESIFFKEYCIPASVMIEE